MNKKSLLMLIALTIIMFLPLVMGMHMYEGDLYDEYIPVKYVQKNHIEGMFGEKGIGTGFPLYRDIQSSPYYIFNILLLINTDIYTIVHLIIMMNILLFVIGAYVLMKGSSRDNYRAMLFAVISGFSTIIILRYGHLSILNSLAPIPLYFAAFRAMTKKGGFRYELLTAVMAFIVLSGGHPQIFAAAVIITTVVFLRRAYWKAELRVLVIFTGLSSVITVPLIFHIISGGGRSDIPVISMNIKMLLNSLYPFLHHKIISLLRTEYYGGNIYTETASFASAAVIIMMIAVICQAVVKRSVKDLRILTAAFILILISFIPIPTVFRTMTRFYQYGILVLMFYAVKHWDWNNRYCSLTGMLIYMIVSALLIIRGFSLEGILVTFASAVIYFLFMLFSYKRIVRLLLLSVIALEMMAMSYMLVNWIPRENTVNAPISDIKGKRLITFVPKEYEFYMPYIDIDKKEIEQSKSFSTYGNRAVYYNALSYNIYNTMTPADYAVFLGDSGIFTGCLTDFYNILEGDLAYDYIFIPDMPFITVLNNKIKSLIIPSCSDTIFIMASKGVIISNAQQCDFRHDYLQNIDYTSWLLVDSDTVKLQGKGLVYMIYAEGTVLTFESVLNANGFRTIDVRNFVLMEAPHYIRSREDRVFDYKHKTAYLGLFPVDFLAGALLSMLTLSISLIYLFKKEKK